MTAPLDKQDANTAALLEAEAARVRPSLGRSDMLIRIFDYLVEQTLAGRTPKEVEFAQEVFGKRDDPYVADDASVRVYIHRLRKKLDSFYHRLDGPHLYIPLGEYHIALHDPRLTPEAEQPEKHPQAEGETASTQRSTGKGYWIAAAIFFALLSATLSLLFFTVREPGGAGHKLVSSFLWRPLADGDRPIFIIAGDDYVVGETPDQKHVTRLIRDFSINSVEDLHRYVATHPDQARRLVGFDFHYLPASTAHALGRIVPVANALTSRSSIRPITMTMSQLEPEVLKDSDIIYIGLLSGLGPLEDPVLDSAGFTFGGTYLELVDRRSGRHYISDWVNILGDKTPRRDYAYLASLPGPSGNRVLILAGTSDAAVKQISEVTTDLAQLDQLASKVAGMPMFEALFEVRTLGNTNLSSSLIVARPLDHNGLLRYRVKSTSVSPASAKESKAGAEQPAATPGK